ncbi:hypothetical protein ACFQ23_06555 [Schaalia naturae]|uniref:Uncharacterized protein n=1 Tax=Schaalia naturae TaxID=635203 RepID=A0ABW2SP68_9ACTO
MEHLIRRARRRPAPGHAPVPPDRRQAVGVGDPERGDVPGWVLITLMTAALVAAIWAIANVQLTALLERALEKVSGI